MAQYYLDIETTGFNPKEDKVISIQVQEIDRGGKPVGDLTIYKEWETSEEEILRKFYRLFIIEGYGWNFIPFGQNLIFDLTFLWERFKKYNLEVEELSKYIYSKPHLDIKHTLVMINKLSFKGASLDKMTNKKTDGRNIPLFYKNKEWSKILEYIKQETESFMEFFEKCNKHLIQLKK